MLASTGTTTITCCLKGKLSPVLYILAIIGTLISTWIAEAIFVAVALIWLIPDRRIENVLSRNDA